MRWTVAVLAAGLWMMACGGLVDCKSNGGVCSASCGPATGKGCELTCGLAGGVCCVLLDAGPLNAADQCVDSFK
jgi:hypothetical protein